MKRYNSLYNKNDLEEAVDLICPNCNEIIGDVAAFGKELDCPYCGQHLQSNGKQASMVEARGMVSVVVAPDFWTKAAREDPRTRQLLNTYKNVFNEKENLPYEEWISVYQQLPPSLQSRATLAKAFREGSEEVGDNLLVGKGDIISPIDDDIKKVGADDEEPDVNDDLYRGYKHPKLESTELVESFGEIICPECGTELEITVASDEYEDSSDVYDDGDMTMEYDDDVAYEMEGPASMYDTPGYFESVQKLIEAADVQGIIDELIDTGWSGSNEEQMKAVQLLKGLATSDDPKSNAFMKKLDSFTTKMKSGDKE